MLVGAGYTEAYTWSLVGCNPHPDAIRLPEPMAAEQALLRTTLVDGLLRRPRERRRGQPAGRAVPQLAQVYLPTGEQLPEERWRVAGIVEGGYDAARLAVEVLHHALKIEPAATRVSIRRSIRGRRRAAYAGAWAELHPALMEGARGLFELDVEALTTAVPAHILDEDVITLSGEPAGHRGGRRA